MPAEGQSAFAGGGGEVEQRACLNGDERKLQGEGLRSTSIVLKPGPSPESPGEQQIITAH